jgi:hypothetical protein
MRGRLRLGVASVARLAATALANSCGGHPPLSGYLHNDSISGRSPPLPIRAVSLTSLRLGLRHWVRSQAPLDPMASANSGAPSPVIAGKDAWPAFQVWPRAEFGPVPSLAPCRVWPRAKFGPVNVVCAAFAVPAKKDHSVGVGVFAPSRVALISRGWTRAAPAAATFGTATKKSIIGCSNGASRMAPASLSNSGGQPWRWRALAWKRRQGPRPRSGLWRTHWEHQEFVQVGAWQPTRGRPRAPPWGAPRAAPSRLPLP